MQFITYVGLSISIFFALLTIATFTLMLDWKQVTAPHRMVVQLALALVAYAACDDVLD